MESSNDDLLAHLKAAVDNDPTCLDARERLLQEFLADPLRHDDPLRIEQIRWFVLHHPRHYICCTPFVEIYPEKAPDAYEELKTMWLRLITESPVDVQLVRGAAAFVAAESTDEGKWLIQSALVRLPDAAALWFDLGRISQDPGERLVAFEKARIFGEQNSNLLVWIAMAAFQAGEFEKARGIADELMALVDEARACFGGKLDWPERGDQLWRRARADSESDAKARTLTDAMGQHAYRKHWAHTVLGLLACRDDDVDRAIFHLGESADVRSDCRLSSYGPSVDLLQQVCARGRWEDALNYVRAWKDTWDHRHLNEWLSSVEERRIPGIAKGE
jgi:hypothetical protein